VGIVIVFLGSFFIFEGGGVKWTFEERKGSIGPKRALKNMIRGLHGEGLLSCTSRIIQRKIKE
jgi:hypothetical protein